MVGELFQQAKLGYFSDFTTVKYIVLEAQRHGCSAPCYV